LRATVEGELRAGAADPNARRGWGCRPWALAVWWCASCCGELAVTAGCNPMYPGWAAAVCVELAVTAGCNPMYPGWAAAVCVELAVAGGCIARRHLAESSCILASSKAVPFCATCGRAFCRRESARCASTSSNTCLRGG
jgi:hypothetical protein